MSATTGRIFYGIAITGVGVLHFIFGGFRGLISAIKPVDPKTIAIPVYLFGLYLIVSGILIIAGKKVKATSIILAYVLILFLLIGHLPWRITHNPGRIGEWTNVLKLMSFIGGAFLVSTGSTENISNKFLQTLSKLAPYGKYFFAVMLLVFGFDHFYYVEFVSSLVPKWIPFPVFWSYFTGICLFGAGLAIFINFRIKLISHLLAIMLFVWLLTIHLVLAIRFPHWNNGENSTACCQCLAFTGIALMIGGASKKEKS
jgi:uncharacterized membrane protein